MQVWGLILRYISYFNLVSFSPNHLNLIVWIAVRGLAKPFGKSNQKAQINFEIISLICQE